MVTLFDLGAEFWFNAAGGKDPMNGFERTIERVGWYRDDSMPRFVVCADSPRSKRREDNPQYKSNRPPKPQAALDALDGAETRIRAWRVPLVKVDGWEADDVIATLCAQAWPEPVRIVGSEKDFFCLMNDSRVQLIGRKGALTSAHCFEKFGVSPSQMTCFLALAGDAADGIPGAENCGPGRAATLLEEFESIAGILAASDDAILALPGIGKKTLEGIRKWDWKASLEMVRMRTDLPIELDEILS